jgi:DNA-binding CsgD family transcriptional regulator
LEVLELIVAGRTDAEIADQLFNSRRTVSTHVQHVYSKIGVATRGAAAAWAVRHDLG